MPGITDVAMISTGVAVRGHDLRPVHRRDPRAARHLERGHRGRQVGRSVLAELKAAELPLAVPDVPVLAKTVEGEFTFHFRSNSPLETGIADRRLPPRRDRGLVAAEGADRAAVRHRAQVRR